MTERPHIELSNLLERFLTVNTITPDSQRIAEVVQQARDSPEACRSLCAGPTPPFLASGQKIVRLLRQGPLVSF